MSSSFLDGDPQQARAEASNNPKGSKISWFLQRKVVIPIAVVLVIVLAGGGFWYYQKRTAPQASENNSQSSLVHWWAMENDSDLVNGGATPVPGVLGGAASFDGINNFVNVRDSNNARYGSDQVTAMAFIKIDAYTDWGRIINKYYPVQGDRLGGYALMMGGPDPDADRRNKIAFMVTVAGDNGGPISERFCYTQANAVSVGEWAQVVGTYDGTVVKVYINGNEACHSDQTDQNKPILNSSSSVITFGELPRYNNSGNIIPGGGSEHYKGIIDEPAIWNQALTQAEIMAKTREHIPNIASSIASFQVNPQANADMTYDFNCDNRVNTDDARAIGTLWTNGTAINDSMIQSQTCDKLSAYLRILMGQGYSTVPAQEVSRIGAIIQGGYTANPLDLGLVGYWNMDSNNTAFDQTRTSLSGSRIHGIPTSTDNVSVSDSESVFGLTRGFLGNGSVYFSNTAGDNSDVTAFQSQSFSVGLRFRSTATREAWKPDDDYQALAGRSNNNGNGYQDQFLITVNNPVKIGNSYLTARVGFGGEEVRVLTAKTNVNDFAWHSVVLTAEVGSGMTIIKMYLDGNLADVQAHAGVPYSQAVGNLNLGSWFMGNSTHYGYYIGFMDELRFYNRTLNAAEVADYNAGRGR